MLGFTDLGSVFQYQIDSTIAFLVQIVQYRIGIHFGKFHLTMRKIRLSVNEADTQVKETDTKIILFCIRHALAFGERPHSQHLSRTRLHVSH